VLAETLGSVGSHYLVHEQGKAAVGVEVNANHLKSVRDGWVHGEAKLIHRGGKMHVWSIEIRDEFEQLICISRLTVMIIPQPKR
ncbi:MAG: PaaI family thioesterase, partial [Flavobacteriales bacterium]